MKHLFILLTACFSFSYLKAQDLLVLSSNDSLNVKVIAENKENKVFFATYRNQEIISDSIDFNKVKVIVRNFFVKNELQISCMDTIFTKDNDTIICKIVEDKKDWYISYLLNGSSKQNIGYYSILRVAKCKMGYFSEKSSSPIKSSSLVDGLSNKKFRFSGNYLFGYRIFKMEDGISQVERKMYDEIKKNHGFQTEFQIAVDKRRVVLVGANYVSLNAESIQDNVILTTNAGLQYSGSLSFKTKIRSFGPNVLIKFKEKPSVHNFAVQIGFNVNLYQETFEIGGFKLDINGIGTSTLYHFLYEYKLNPNFSFLAYTGIVLSTITNVEINENGNITKRVLENEEAINTSKIPLGLGLSFNF